MLGGCSLLSPTRPGSCPLSNTYDVKQRTGFLFFFWLFPCKAVIRSILKVCFRSVDKIQIWKQAKHGTFLPPKMRTALKVMGSCAAAYLWHLTFLFSQIPSTASGAVSERSPKVLLPFPYFSYLFVWVFVFLQRCGLRRKAVVHSEGMCGAVLQWPVLRRTEPEFC